MQNVIITKRIEPYDLIQGMRRNYAVEEFIFVGRNKFEVLDCVLNKIEEISKLNVAFGLYMKNVNKFYLVSSDIKIDNIDENIHSVILKNILNLTDEDITGCVGIEFTDDRDKVLSAVDLGKAEASLFIA